METLSGKLINLIHCITRLINQREMAHFVKGYSGPQKAVSARVETIDLSITKRSIPTFANIAELSLPTPGFEDTEWDTSNLRVR